jgi:hypothetical protein
MRRSCDPETRYFENIRHERKALEEFAAYEREWADDLLLWYRCKKRDIPNDEYRAVAFFKNREYLSKPGSLTLLYLMSERLWGEVKVLEKETGFDWLAYRYRSYAAALEKGGYGGFGSHVEGGK